MKKPYRLRSPEEMAEMMKLIVAVNKLFVRRKVDRKLGINVLVAVLANSFVNVKEGARKFGKLLDDAVDNYAPLISESEPKENVYE
jgi:hypothetical protein